MNKLLKLMLVFCLIFSCTQETDEQQNPGEPEVRIAQNQFDTSHLGVYKGLFATNDGMIRGTVEVTLTPSNQGIAKITLSSGEQFELKSSRVKLTVDNKVSNLRFSSEGLNAINVNLEFSVNADGSQPAISNVAFDNQASDILIAKNLSRAPLAPITGTYVRTAGSGGFPNTARTWNIMSIGEGAGQTFALQIAFGGRVYNSPAANNTQTNCSDGAGLTSCDVDGTASILGYDVLFSGTHAYSLGSTQSCSSVSGTWVAPEFGNSSGTFASDVDAADCVVEGSDNEVVIGTQTWMLTNLDVETYRNGDPIPQVQNPNEWSFLSTGAWCYYNNDSANGVISGKLYNWYAVNDSRGLAPLGWHVPSTTEWNTLASSLGGNSVAGGKMKSVNGWALPNNGATNESGFTALPGGIRTEDGVFTALSTYANFFPSNVSGYAALRNNTVNLEVGNFSGFSNFGYSVRCIKD